MHSSEKNQLISHDELLNVVKTSIKSQTIAKKLDEAYVANAKSYKQVSELVSQRTKDSHASLYKDYVQNLNKVSAELDTADSENANSTHSSFRSAKLDEVYNINAVWLHELYFANCFDPHSELFMDSRIFLRLERDFGTIDDWQRNFIACAASAGQGWAICGYNMFLKRYVNTFVSNNSQDVMLGLYPVIVLDLHEHAYYRDYLTDKKSFIIAQMKEINWKVVEERVERADSINEALK